ncbi:transporter of the major facilitator superfamily (MFS) [Legionella busanensis]|uniref:Transporter of the major facilitator superfamily (MFS) n=1 Tax=Legionella busanensis TaxID=190655 RepID=A0A378JK18_9GAMM|nr:hypothetical protein [Legionella busanensis]STX51081.1 transporter of the major facilitator superfamily (MFS) [Legionella busanensis]
MENERSTLFGYIYLSASLAYIIGPLIGGSLADSRLVSWFNYSTPFELCCISLIILLVFIIFTFKETLVSSQKKEKINYSKLLTNFSTVFTEKNYDFYFLLISYYT